MEKIKKTVLVVEDELPLLKAAEAKLLINGFTVFTARSVEDAKKILEKEGSVDAVWLDHYLLGKADGYDFSKYIRTQPSTKNIPIFLVTNTASPEKIERYLLLGGIHYYMKSNFSLETITQEINKIIESKTQQGTVTFSIEGLL